MEGQVSFLKYLFILHIACLQAVCAQSGMGPRVAWQRLDGAGSLNSPRVASRRWRQMSAVGLPEERYDYSYDGGTIEQIDVSEPLRQGFRGFSRQRVVNRDRGVRYGQFNSDTHGCNGIQARSCSAHPHCAGCLGLYACNLSLGKCQLKGLSQKTDKFLQTLRNI